VVSNPKSESSDAVVSDDSLLLTAH
jgi:hypothetical protein